MILYFCIISLALSECIMYAFDILSQCECEYFHISHLRSREFAMHSNILGIWNWIQATMHDLDRGEIFMDYLKLINFLFHVLHFALYSRADWKPFIVSACVSVQKQMPPNGTMNYVCDSLAEMCRSKREICSKIYNKNRNEAKQLSVAITTAGQYQSIELLTEWSAIDSMQPKRLGIVYRLHRYLRIDLRLLDVFLTLLQTHIISEPQFQLRSSRLRSIRPGVKIVKIAI